MTRRRFFTCTVLFAAVFIFFIIPPLTVSESQGKFQVFVWSFPLKNLITALTTVLAVILLKKLTEEEKLPENCNCTEENKNLAQNCNTKKSEPKLIRFIKASSVFLITFGLIWISSALLQFIAGLSGKSINRNFTKPEGLEWLFCILIFISGAVTEELLYRIFLPESLIFFSSRIKKERLKKIFMIVSEIAAALIFAFSHKYAGIFSVINAFTAHFAFRFCYKKTKKIELNFISHFLYNFLSFLVLIYV